MTTDGKNTGGRADNSSIGDCHYGPYPKNISEYYKDSPFVPEWEYPSEKEKRRILRILGADDGE